MVKQLTLHSCNSYRIFRSSTILPRVEVEVEKEGERDDFSGVRHLSDEKA